MRADNPAIGVAAPDRGPNTAKQYLYPSEFLQFVGCENVVPKYAFVAELPSERDMARGFRRWLAKAHVDRAELHAGSRTRKVMTFHDLRAGGLTRLSVRGDDSLKIMQRAGHTEWW